MNKYISIVITLIFCSIPLSQERFSCIDVFDLQYAKDPQIAPDNSKIVYVRTKMDIMKDSKRSSIWIIDTDGNNHQKLTSSNHDESSQRWAPDSKQIAFVSSSDDDNGRFYLEDLSSNGIGHNSELIDSEIPTGQ